MSPGWNGYIATLLVLNLAGCAWLLWWTSKRRPGDPKPEDTSHYWDGDITEYNKPMPRWWINGFFIALAFGVGYLLWFGGIGTWTGFGFSGSSDFGAAPVPGLNFRIRNSRSPTCSPSALE